MDVPLLAGGIGAAFLVGGGGLAYALRGRWRRRREVLALLSQVARALAVTAPQIKRYPVPSLTGYYHTYPLAIECVRKGAQLLWRIHSELAQPLDGRLVLYGEGRHGKMRELYGMEVVLTGDVAFDHRMLLAATNEVFARHIFTPYLRSRVVGLPLAEFKMDCHQSEIYAECHTGMGSAAAPLIPMIHILFDVCDRLLSGR